MYCAKCMTMVSIADSRCPKCNADLLEFGSTKTSPSQERGSRPYAQAVKNIRNEVFREIGGGIETLKQEASSEPFAAAILEPIYDNLLNLLSGRYGSEAEIDRAFDDKVVPAIDHLTREKDTRELLRDIDEIIQYRLGDDAFYHYKMKGDEVLKILRSGEIAIKWIDLLKQADLSVILFPFFKAVERSCRIHTQKCYDSLKGNPKLAEIAGWLPSLADHLSVEGIPSWLADRKSKIIEVIKGLLSKNEYHTGGALKTGVVLYLFGRTWELKIRQSDRAKQKTFRIENLLNAQGSDGEKENLAHDLHQFQFLRNERVHGKVENNHETVTKVRELAYSCLTGLPQTLAI